MTQHGRSIIVTYSNTLLIAIAICCLSVSLATWFVFLRPVPRQTISRRSRERPSSRQARTGSTPPGTVPAFGRRLRFPSPRATFSSSRSKGSRLMHSTSSILRRQRPSGRAEGRDRLRGAWDSSDLASRLRHGYEAGRRTVTSVADLRHPDPIRRGSLPQPSLPQLPPRPPGDDGNPFRPHPAAPQHCRVLELGCAGGGNLIPMALAYPTAASSASTSPPGRSPTARR